MISPPTEESSAARARSAWTWPAVLGLGSVVALIAALLTDGRPVLNTLCLLILLGPIGVVARALWRR